MASTRVIKKYPNRRLYDTEISSYITIEDVRQLIVDGEDFEVRDARSGEDLPGDEERGEVAHDVGERRSATHEVVLMASVRRALVVRVVLVQLDREGT